MPSPAPADANSPPCIEMLSGETLAAAHGQLLHLLRVVVEHGASLGFLHPVTDEEAADYWHGLTTEVREGARTVLVAREGSGGGAPIVGTAQLAWGMKPNGRHRAEVCKLMVLPSHRRRGVGERLMQGLESLAQQCSLRMLYLDTSEGESGAMRFYERLGYVYAGGIPEWARDPDGTMAKNAIYYKIL